MKFDEYFKKMCGNSEDTPSSSFKVNGTTTPFNKKELRWLEKQLESCLDWPGAGPNPKSNKMMYKTMLKKVQERLELL